jgi:hypothetical protein
LLGPGKSWANGLWSEPNAEEGAAGLRARAEKREIFFSFFISNFSNAFSNKDLNRI